MIVILAAAVLFAADYVCKYLVDKNIKENEDISILKDKLILRKCYNHGLAMNTLANKPKLVFFLSSTALGMFLSMYIPEIFKKKNHFAKIGSALVLGGAISNLVDHFRKGIVVDYLSLNSSNEKVRRIVFNLADVFIAVGGAVLVVVELCRRTRDTVSAAGQLRTLKAAERMAEKKDEK